jgi:hypothetical protein
MLQALSIEKYLNRKYRKPIKNMVQDIDRTCKYLTINMTENLTFEDTGGGSLLE